MERLKRHPLVRSLGVMAGYGVIAVMGIALLGAALNAMFDAADPPAAWLVLLVVAFLGGAAVAVASVRYELAAHSPEERVRRHLRMQTASFVILAVTVLILAAWGWLPSLVRVAAASAGSGFVLGFLAMFIPNRRRALEIRDISRDD